MNVIIFGATGGLGQYVSRAAVAAGHRVALFVRSPDKLDPKLSAHSSVRTIVGDVMDSEAVRAASEGSEIAINCTSPAGGDGAEEMVRSIVPSAAAAGVRAFYLIGGLGALWAPGSGRTVLVQDWEDVSAMKQYGLGPQVPREVIRQMTRGHLASMAFLQTTGHAHTYVCPGLMVPGPASDARVVTLDEIGGPSPARVPYADIAEVIVDDLGHGALLGHRVCVSSSAPSEP
ncbi:MAG: SDR family oxidoreductase [Myxococcales bacterium]|nr:SDR family oxidoreductase [Myxococcales bacterium]